MVEKKIWFGGFHLRFSDILLGFNYAKVIGNLWSICLGVSILSSSPWIDLLFTDVVLEGLLNNLITFSRDS